jgi:hypothetical protein
VEGFAGKIEIQGLLQSTQHFFITGNLKITNNSEVAQKIKKTARPPPKI